MMDGEFGARVAETLERGSEAFVALDANGCYTYVNPNAAAMFGRKAEELIGKRIWTEFPETVGQPFHQACERAMADQTPVAREEYYAPHDRWFENRIYPSAEGLTIYFTDITERKLAERALRDSDERLRLALDAARTSMFDWDVLRNRITWSRWNEALGRLDEFCDTYETFSERVHPEDLPGLNWEVDRCIMERDPFVREFRMVWPDSAAKWVLGRGRFTFNEAGEPVRLLGMAVDVTEGKQAEETLRLSEERFRTLVENAADGVFIVDRQGFFCDVNAAGCAMLGYTVDEMLRLSISDAVVADERHRVGPALSEVASGRPYARDWLALRKDGTTFPVEARGRLLPDGRLLGIIRDITDRKRSEQQLTELAESLRALSGRIQAVREEEGRRIARELHDELGQALTGLKIDLSWMEKQLARIENGPDAAALRERAAAMRRQIDETVQAVRRIATELRPAVLDDFGLAAAIECQLQDFQQRTGLECTLTITTEEISIDPACATAIFRILVEALTNVARHAGARHVEVRLDRDAGGLILNVRDDGNGATPDRIARPQSLGLLGMRERAKAFGGEVEVTSAPGRGTVVHVRIPLS